MKKKKLTEAFPQIATADNFFQYGVPAPPSYYAFGGSLTEVPVYPQAQTEEQFFTPTYHNSNNAYKVGGSYIEEFPQARTLGWGPTNHFMLQEGGDVPQEAGAMASQGMLPKMQEGDGLGGIMAKTKQDMQHYYGGNYPMFQDGGSPSDGGNTNFYSDRVNTFLDKVRSRAYDALPQEIENESVQEEAQYGYSGTNMYNPYKTTAYKNAYQSNMDSSQMANQDFMQSFRQHENFNRYANRPQGQSAAKYGVAMKGGGSLPQAKNGLEWFPEYNLNFPKFKHFDPNAIEEPKQDWKTVNIGGVNYPVGANDEVYFNRPLSGGGYNDPYAINRGGYGYNNYFSSPYGRDYMVDWSNATMAQLTGQALKDAKISGAETLTRRALLPGNRNAGVRLYFNGYGQPVAAPSGATATGDGTNTNTTGTNVNPNDPGRPGFMGRLFPNRYNQSKFNPNASDAKPEEMDYTRLKSNFDPYAGSEYDKLLHPNRVERVSNRLQNIGEKADRMHQYGDMLAQLRGQNKIGNDRYQFTQREQNRTNRLEDRYNRIAERHQRQRYRSPIPQQAYGGDLPMAQFGPPSFGDVPRYNSDGFNPLFNPNFNPGSISAPSIEQSVMYPGANFTGGILGKETTYDKPVAEGFVKPFEFSEDPTATKPKDDGFFVDILQGRKKKQRDPNFPIALTKFAANKIENALSPAKQEFARSTRADQVYGTIPTTSGSRGDYVMNTPAGQFFRPDDMNPWGKKNTGFNMPMAQYGGDGDMLKNLREGDEVYLTESQIQDIIKRGGKLSYL
jgi:hypothetical protein